MKKIILFLVMAFFWAPFIVSAANVSSACSGVRTDGQEACINAYNTCVETSNNPNGCSMPAVQYGTSMGAYNACFNRNNNSDGSCNSFLTSATKYSQDLDQVTTIVNGPTQQGETGGSPSEQVGDCKVTYTFSSPKIISGVTPSNCPGGNGTWGPTGSFNSNGSGNTNNGTNNTPAIVGVGNIDYKPLEPIPGFTGSGNLKFGELLTAIFKTVIILAGFIAIGAFVFAGIEYMLSDAVNIKTQAKKRLRAALIGLVLLLGCWLILYTINPQLVIFGNALNPVSQQYTLLNGSQTAPANPLADEPAARERNCVSDKSSGGFGGILAKGGACPNISNGIKLLGTSNSYTACETIQTTSGYESCFYNP